MSHISTILSIYLTPKKLFLLFLFFYNLLMLFHFLFYLFFCRFVCRMHLQVLRTALTKSQGVRVRYTDSNPMFTFFPPKKPLIFTLSHRLIIKWNICPTWLERWITCPTCYYINIISNFMLYFVKMLCSMNFYNWHVHSRISG